MPELPEVETVRRTLSEHVLGLRILDVIVYHNNMIRSDDFIDRIKNQTIHEIKRMGKHLLFMLDTDVLISHLRMEGKYFYEKDHEKTKHEHVIFYLNNGYTLRYHDVRKFGTFHLKSNKTYLNELPLKHLGLEPEMLDQETLYHSLKTKTIPIKSALLDQSIMSGLGNIYVDETLFMAKIHPELKSNTMSLEMCASIIKHAKDVLAFATSLGGSTIRTYYATMGISGKFQNELKVHTRENQKCHVCMDTIIKMKVGGRGTYVCPSCQKKNTNRSHR